MLAACHTAKAPWWERMAASLFGKREQFYDGDTTVILSKWRGVYYFEASK